jgi:hypothetical protein
LIADGLLENHSLLGLHMAGNEAETNAAGFVEPQFSIE